MGGERWELSPAARVTSHPPPLTSHLQYVTGQTRGAAPTEADTGLHVTCKLAELEYNKYFNFRMYDNDHRLRRFHGLCRNYGGKAAINLDFTDWLRAANCGLGRCNLKKICVIVITTRSQNL